jgi:hypothetical protein
MAARVRPQRRLGVAIWVQRHLVQTPTSHLYPPLLACKLAHLLVALKVLAQSMLLACLLMALLLEPAAAL